jgi:hypothetical protein
MLETVRIRRAGYNVRLTYEEFIQLYRILLPKGLLSSKEDVRDFMNHFMELNKQHYQLGMTKIYMRENQKMRLDIRLHTKIIESIVSIQRWFRAFHQRRKFLQFKQAAVTIQSYWRMCLAQRQFHYQRACYNGAAIAIQSAWRMYVERKNYLKIRQSMILLQAHIRGRQARQRFQQSLKHKHMRERQKLRSTQSLPVHERSVDSTSHIEQSKRMRAPTPQYSLDADIELCSEESPSHRLTKQKRDQMLDQTEKQIRNLIINREDSYFKKPVPAIDPFISYQPPPTSYKNDDVMDIGTKIYEVEKAMKRNDEGGEMLKRFDATKMPIRRVDSGPMRRDLTNVVRPKPTTDVEIVLVNPMFPPSTGSSSMTARSGPYNQEYSLETLPHRRDLVSRSLNEQFQNYQPPIVYHQPLHAQKHLDNAEKTKLPTPKGMFIKSIIKSLSNSKNYFVNLNLN